MNKNHLPYLQIIKETHYDVARYIYFLNFLIIQGGMKAQWVAPIWGSNPRSFTL